MSLTPNDRQYKRLSDPVSISECWIDKSDYSFLNDITNEHIIEACGEINRLCNRKFNHQEVDFIYTINNNFNQYITISLPNYPVKAITDIYLQVASDFSLVSLDNLQIFREEGVIKLLPITTELTTERYDMYNEVSYWVRYTSGFKTKGDINDDYPDVPKNVKKATAIMAKYLYQVEKITAGVSSFRTQTYSQTNAKPNDDPLYSRILQLLDNYIINSYA